MRSVQSLAAAAMLSAAALAPSALAQSGAFCLPTISPFASNNGGSAGGAVYFDMTVNAPVSLTDLVMNYSIAAGAAVGVDVYTTPTTYVGQTASPGAWTMVGSGSGTSAGLNLRTVCTLNAPISLTPGSYGIALVATGGTGHRYTNGNGSNQAFSDSFLSLTLGAASNVPFTGSAFTPRVANIEVCYNAPGAATATPFGSSCGAGGPTSLYELFTTNNDLSNHQGLSFFWNGTDYVAVPGASAIVAPTSGTPLALTDDSTLQVTLPFSMPTQRGLITDVWVCSNGWVSFESTTSNDLSESTAELLSLFTRVACLWDDLNPAATGSGGVYAEVDPSNPALFHITYDGVFEFGGSTPNTVQLSLSASGNFELKFGAISILDGLVGYSPGNGVGASGAVDISALASPVVFGDGSLAPTLTSVARPTIGQTAITRTNNIRSASAVAGFHLYGFARIPGGLDLSVIGATGCTLHGTGEVVVPFSTAAATAQHSLAIPLNNALVGVNFYCQSAIVEPGVNGLGGILTNAIEWTFDIN